MRSMAAQLMASTRRTSALEQILASEGVVMRHQKKTVKLGRTARTSQSACSQIRFAV